MTSQTTTKDTSKQQPDLKEIRQGQENIRKFVIGRTLMIGALLMAGTAFAYAVFSDRSEGTLMDDQGIIDDELIEPLDGGAS